jgi:tetratricopeptide (TPR) repeat protein
MNAERWHTAEELFHLAAELSPAERDAFLAQRCPDDVELRAVVEQLLASESTIAGRAIAAAVGSAAVAWMDTGTSSVIGRRIGPYRVTELIGEGGMGSVYRAVRDDDEFRQEVALKLVKRGMDTRSILLRFRNERQILATLEHANIARLLDGGTTEDGLPYFVMECVRGRPITEYCAENKLGLRERLSLFRTVCDAVQHAHRNLVVHRDLKPSNILVTGDGTVKLLDFGISKVLATQGASDQTLTIPEVRMFTPDYGSPEQVRGEHVSTATDVYALGAVLYELLSGKRPHNLTTYSTSELVESICQREPLRLSEAAPPELRRTLRGDLDNIVARALTKDAERRYASADLLGRDLGNYLAGHPVTARPDTRLYRTRKFIRRHRLAVAAAALAGVALIATATVAVREAVKARERFDQVRKMARTLIFDFHDELARVPGNTKASALLVSTAREYLDNLARSAGNDRSLLLELAEAWERLAATQGGSSAVNLNQRTAALESRRRALEIRTRLAGFDLEQDARLVDLNARVSNDLRELGRLTDSLELGRRAVERSDSLLKNAPPLYAPERSTAHAFLARTLQELGHFDEAEAELRRADELLAASSDFRGRRLLLVNRQDRADLLGSLGRLEEAVQLLESVDRDAAGLLAGASPGRPQQTVRRMTHVTWATLAEIYDNPLSGSLDDPVRALTYRDKLCQGWQDFLKLDPNDNSARLFLAVCDSETAVTLLKLDPPQAVVRARRGLELFQRLERTNPDDTAVVFRSARGATRLAMALLAAGQPAAAHTLLNESIRKHRDLLSGHRDNPRFTSSLVWTLMTRARVERALRNHGDARHAAAEAAQLITPLAGGMDLHFRRMAAQAYTINGELAAGTDQCQWYRRALATWESWNVNSSPWVRRQKEAAVLKAAQCSESDAKL